MPGDAGARSAGSAEGGGVGSSDELPGHRDQLGEVLHAGLVLGVVAGLELGEVPAPAQRGLEHHVGPLTGLDEALELLDDRDEASDSGQGAGGDPRGVVGAAQRLPERQRVATGESLHTGLGPVADAALGHVEDAAQR